MDMENNNQIIGEPKTNNTKIIFKGSGNKLFCEQGVTLDNCYINFAGNNSLIYLSKNRFDYKCSITIFNNSIVYFGCNNYFNNTISISVSEQKNVFFGSENILSYRIECRTADPHLIYDFNNNRINPSKSIFVGDHVWIGADCFLLKGTQIHSGSIIGAKSLVSKELDSCSSYGGVPVKRIKKQIFWDGACVHDYKEKETAQSENYTVFLTRYRNGDIDQYKFCYNADEYIDFNTIDKNLNDLKTAEQKIEYLKCLSGNKNRFSK